MLRELGDPSTNISVFFERARPERTVSGRTPARNNLAAGLGLRLQCRGCTLQERLMQ